MILDLFAGPGGWDEGAKSLGLNTIGIEWDHAACQTAVSAGHPRVRADVAQYPTEPFTGKVTGLIASPPCQAWSMAGTRKGERDRAHCHELADRMGRGDDSIDLTSWEDERSPLVCQPVRWVRDLRPEWVALEEVPAVESLWRHFAVIFRGWGYSTWVGVLNAADYGVPQTRQRCILMASRSSVAPPVPTHSKDGCEGDLFGNGRDQWVSMAQALDWKPEAVLVNRRDSPAWVAEHGERENRTATMPAPTFTAEAHRWVLRNGNQANACERDLDEPAGTLFFGGRMNAVDWVCKRPSTAVCGDPRIFPPGFRGRAEDYAADGTYLGKRAGEGSIRVSVQEAGVLQSFPADYPWQGSRTKQFQQVGNAVPPRLAAHVLGALVRAEVPA